VGFPYTPRMAGALVYQPLSGEPMTLAVIQAYAPNEGDAWAYIQDALGRYFERSLALLDRSPVEAPREPILAVADRDLPPEAFEVLGTCQPLVSLLGRRTAEMHDALASRPDDPAFAPEGYSPFYQRSLYQSLRNRTNRVFQDLRKRVKELSGDAAVESMKVLGLEGDIIRHFRTIHDHRLTSLQIRCHGNFGLRKVLLRGNDVAIFDFRGEPGRSLAHRRLKRSSLTDVAGMLRSIHIATATALAAAAGLSGRPEDGSFLESRARMWNYWASAAFLRGYGEAAAGRPFHPSTLEELRTLLFVFYLERTIAELGRALLREPERVPLSLQGILRVLEARG
jgi:maltose alpha-D-glucosyltransferase / alpha-amylase